MIATRSLLIALAVGLALIGTTSSVDAQCAFAHPKKAKKFQTDLVPAFERCAEPGGPVPNTTTEDGVPACTPVTEFDNGSKAWFWDSAKTTGALQMKPAKTKDPFDPLSSGDIKIQLKLNKVVDGGGLPASGVGTLDLLMKLCDQGPRGRRHAMGV